MSDFELMNRMKQANTGTTDLSDLIKGGSVDYFYVGAYSDDDDNVLGGILDKLLSGSMDYETEDETHEKSSYSRGHDNVFEIEGASSLVVQTDACDKCGGGKHSKKQQNTEENDFIITDELGPSQCEYDDCPVIVKDDEYESIVVSSLPLADTDIGTVEHIPDPDEDNVLIVSRDETPLVVDTTIIEKRNEDIDKNTSQNVSDAFFEDETEPIVEKNPKIFSVKPKKKGTKEVHGSGEKKNDKEGNVKMEDYEVVYGFIKEYIKTINDKSFKRNE